MVVTTYKNSTLESPTGYADMVEVIRMRAGCAADPVSADHDHGCVQPDDHLPAEKDHDAEF